MPRNGSGVYSLPSGYSATDGQTATATQHNEPLEDIGSDLNTPRPIPSGGTAASSASGARTNLDVPGKGSVETITGDWTVSGSWSVSGTWTFTANFGLQSSTANALTIGNTSEDAEGSEVRLQKGRGAGSAAQIAASDELGSVRWFGYDGTAYIDAASIEATATTDTGDFDATLTYTANSHAFVGDLDLSGVTNSDAFSSLLLDEDDFASDSSEQGATQRSIGAKIDSSIVKLQAILSDTKPSGTDGQIHAANTWVTQELNTTDYDPNSLISLSANEFTPVNNGHVVCNVLMRDEFAVRVYNVTDAVVAPGVGVGSANGAGDRCIGTVTAPVTGGKTYRLEFFHSSTARAGDLNLAGVSEVFASVAYYA